jgi:hypothetical protein
LSNSARQVQIDRRLNAIKTILDSSDYDDFRTKRIQNHVKGIREILLNLISSELPVSDRKNAGRDLGVIVTKAWELSHKTYASDKTVVISFPSVNGRFNASTMAAIDREKEDPFTLQSQQTRLKLVVTPIVTIRDDHGLGIQVKNLLEARVLTVM